MGLILAPLIAIIFNAFALYALTEIVDGIVYTGDSMFFIVGGVILGLLNFFIKPLAKILSFPAIFLTGGLFLIVINVGILWLLSYILNVAEFADVTLSFENLQSYVIGAIVLGIINWLLNLLD